MEYKRTYETVRANIDAEVRSVGSINSDEIISILRSEIEDYDVHARDQEVGTVIGIGDGIATIYGIDHAM